MSSFVSRREALAKGLSRYFTGKPCKHGHICERYPNGGCVECTSVDARRRYIADPKRSYAVHRQWREVRVGYTVWENMIRRCYNPNARNYKNYGGRGIRVCGRWRFGEDDMSGYECWFLDMGRKPTPKHSLDRWPDNNGHYEPSNCRWATRSQQRQNQRLTEAEIIRKKAKARGLSRYSTGKPCPKGHVAERYVSSRNCVICAGEANRVYKQLQRKQHHA